MARSLGWTGPGGLAISRSPSRYGGSSTFVSPFSSLTWPQPPKVTNSSAMVGWMAYESERQHVVILVRNKGLSQLDTDNMR